MNQRIGRPQIALIAIAIIGILLVWGFSTSNRLLYASNDVKAAQAQIETAYQRRFDLIDNLYNTANTASFREQEILQAVTDARTKVAASPDSAEAQDELTRATTTLIATAEAYPEITSSQAWISLMDQLEGTENRIFTARSDYNGYVTYYNNLVGRFPTSIVAGLCGYEPQELFEADAAASQAPRIPAARSQG